MKPKVYVTRRVPGEGKLVNATGIWACSFCHATFIRNSAVSYLDFARLEESDMYGIADLRSLAVLFNLCPHCVKRAFYEIIKRELGYLPTLQPVEAEEKR